MPDRFVDAAVLVNAIGMFWRMRAVVGMIAQRETVGVRAAS